MTEWNAHIDVRVNPFIIELHVYTSDGSRHTKTELPIDAGALQAIAEAFRRQYPIPETIESRRVEEVLTGQLEQANNRVVRLIEALISSALPSEVATNEGEQHDADGSRK